MASPCILVGPATVTCSSAYKGTLAINDLPGTLLIKASEAVDLGALYTQKQILDSVELKRQILNGQLVVTITGTTPSLEHLS